MTIQQWTLCAAVVVGAGAGCGSVKALGSDAAGISDPGGGAEGAPHPDAGVLPDAGVPLDAGSLPPPPGPRACSGMACDDLDPTESVNASTGATCSAGATTATGGSIDAGNGRLELRWGPSCQVNWARFTPNAGGARYRIWASRESPSFSSDRYEFTTTAQLQEYSNQVYAPGHARACIEQWSGSIWVNQTCTPWI